MTVEIQLIEGITETEIPLIKLTKSRNGKTGTATFIFIQPNSLKFLNYQNLIIHGMYLLWENKKIITTDIKIFFKDGKPYLLRGLFIFKNSTEWFNFLNFINHYSKEMGLSFTEKNQIF